MHLAQHIDLLRLAPEAIAMLLLAIILRRVMFTKIESLENQGRLLEHQSHEINLQIAIIKRDLEYIKKAIDTITETRVKHE